MEVFKTNLNFQSFPLCCWPFFLLMVNNSTFSCVEQGLSWNTDEKKCTFVHNELMSERLSFSVWFQLTGDLSTQPSNNLPGNVLTSDSTETCLSLLCYFSPQMWLQHNVIFCLSFFSAPSTQLLITGRCLPAGVLTESNPADENGSVVL